MWRKNIAPFRFMGSVYYTYTVPGSTGGITTYNGDIVNARAIAEWIVDDKRGDWPCPGVPLGPWTGLSVGRACSQHKPRKL